MYTLILTFFFRIAIKTEEEEVWKQHSVLTSREIVCTLLLSSMKNKSASIYLRDLPSHP